MRKRQGRTSCFLSLRRFISWIVCWSTPKLIVDAINDAVSVQDLDHSISEISGLDDRRDEFGK